MKSKKIFIGIVLLACFGTYSNASPTMTPMEAVNKCTPSQNPLYGHLGHQDTTYIIADIAGQSIKNTLALSYFSQYPDADKKFDAIVNAVKNKIPYANDKFTQDAVVKLHSLHGGDSDAIKNRRDNLENLISEYLKNSNDIWKAGLLIHSFGDSYAHTMGKFGTTKEHAFGPEVGHLFHSIIGDDPDKVARKENQEKYFAYVDRLYDLLKTADASQKRLDNFKNEIRNSKCDTDDCLEREVFFKQGNVDLSKYTSCMDTNMKPLSKEQVQDIMDKIK
ncbi:hypothetical protein [Acinetobacter sp. TUM15521]|nr:hypothetical protein [Acinetobacter sp. TUM15521]